MLMESSSDRLSTHTMSSDGASGSCSSESRQLPSSCAEFQVTMMTDSAAGGDAPSARPPLVSVVVPVLDEASGLDDVLWRLRRQSYSRIEMIIADGGSTDGTRDIIARHAAADPRVRQLENPGRIQSAGLNRALAASNGDVIVRLDGHSFVEPDYVERCVSL